MPDFSFNEQQLALAQEISHFAEEHLGFNGGTLRQRWQKATEVGLPGLVIPEEYGGRGFGAMNTVIALEGLGRGGNDAGFNFSLAAHLACVVPIKLHGDASQKQRWLTGIAAGQLIAANGMTESTAGSDVFQMNSRAVPVEGGFRLSGKKTYCSNGPEADLVVAYALTDPSKGYFGGISTFVLEKEHNHFEAGPQLQKAGLLTCPLGEISFNGSTIPHFYQLGEDGAGGQIFQQSMEWERICLGALHLGEMERFMKQAVAFTRKRVSGDKSLAKYQAITHPLAELKTRLVAGRQLLHYTAWKLDQGHKVANEASMTKLYVSELYRDFALQLQRIYAGVGYREDHAVMRLVNDAMGAVVYSGTSEVQKNVIARYLGLR